MKFPMVSLKQLNDIALKRYEISNDKPRQAYEGGLRCGSAK